MFDCHGEIEGPSPRAPLSAQCRALHAAEGPARRPPTGVRPPCTPCFLTREIFSRFRVLGCGGRGEGRLEEGDSMSKHTGQAQRPLQCWTSGLGRHGCCLCLFPGLLEAPGAWHSPPQPCTACSPAGLGNAEGAQPSPAVGLSLLPPSAASFHWAPPPPCAWDPSPAARLWSWSFLGSAPGF